MKNKILEKIKSHIMLSQYDTLDIHIPLNLFYYAEGLENGYEHHLENKKIFIFITAPDERDSCNITITIKEDIDTSDNLLTLKQYKKKKDIFFDLPYQKARRLILDMIVDSEPHSLNLITE